MATTALTANKQTPRRNYALPEISHDNAPYSMGDAQLRRFIETERAHRVALRTVVKDFGRLERCVGNGVAGCVYECQEYGTGERVAVKVVHHEHFTPEEVLMGFADHPNIARMLWWTYCTPYYLIAYDFVPGARDIVATMSATDWGVTERFIARVVYDVASGLAHLHDRGVAHMDLKVENVLLVPNGHQDYTAMIIDFGSANIKSHGRKKRHFYFAPCVHNDHIGQHAPSKSLRPTESEKSVANAWKHYAEIRTGHKCSDKCAAFRELKRRGIACSHSDRRCTHRAITLSYCPPELALEFDFANCDGYAADAYALGIMMFRMAFGFLPYDDDYVHGWANEHQKTKADAYFRLPIPKSHTFSRGFIRLMLQLTSANPNHRSSARDVLSDPWVLDQLQSAPAASIYCPYGAHQQQQPMCFQAPYAMQQLPPTPMFYYDPFLYGRYYQQQ